MVLKFWTTGIERFLGWFFFTNQSKIYLWTYFCITTCITTCYNIFVLPLIAKHAERDFRSSSNSLVTSTAEYRVYCPTSTCEDIHLISTTWLLVPMLLSSPQIMAVWSIDFHHSFLGTNNTETCVNNEKNKTFFR